MTQLCKENFFFDVERKDYVCATVCTSFEKRSTFRLVSRGQTFQGKGTSGLLRETTFRCGVITANAKLFPQRTIASYLK